MTTPYPLPEDQEDLWIRVQALDAAVRAHEPVGNEFYAEKQRESILTSAEWFEAYIRGGE